MKFLYMTDVHEYIGAMLYVAQNKNVDAIILGGDIVSFGDLGHFWDALALLKRFSNGTIFFVPGNWEPIEILLWEKFNDAINLHANKVTYCEEILCGVGGVAPRHFFFPLEFDLEDMQYYLLKLEKKLMDEKRVSIFSSHMIPHDNDYLIRFVRRLKPSFALCGHAHNRKFVRSEGNTIFVNPGALYDGEYCIALASFWFGSPFLLGLSLPLLIVHY